MESKTKFIFFNNIEKLPFCHKTEPEKEYANPQLKSEQAQSQCVTPQTPLRSGTTLFGGLGAQESEKSNKADSLKECGFVQKNFGGISKRENEL